MRRLFLSLCLVLESACSSYRVRCDAHLRPINPPQMTTSGSPGESDASAKGIRASVTATTKASESNEDHRD